MPAEDRSVRGNTIKPSRIEEAEYIEAEEIKGVFSQESPSRAITYVDDALTFAESDVTVSHSQTVLNADSIEISSDPTSSVSRPSDGSSWSDWAVGGLQIDVTNDIYALEADISANSDGVSQIEVWDSNKDTLWTKSVSATAGNTVRFDYEFAAGGSYYLIAAASTHGRNTSVSTPYTAADLAIIDGYNDNNGDVTDYVVAFNNLVANPEGPLDGSATISWPAPELVASWDLATYQATDDGETVSVDVTDGTTTLEGIAQNADISDLEGNPEIQVSLARSVATNNPTLDFAARRFRR